MIADVPIRRRCVILDIEIVVVAVGQSVGNDFNLVAASFIDVPPTTVTDGSTVSVKNNYVCAKAISCDKLTS